MNEPTRSNANKVDLHEMCSWRMWEMAHTKDKATLRKLQQPTRYGARLDGNKLTFEEVDDTSPDPRS